MTKITFNKKKKMFHLQNEYISYIFEVLPNGYLAQSYFGEVIDVSNDENFVIQQNRPMTTYVEDKLSLQNQPLEYPNFGTTDYRRSAFDFELEDGSRITDFVYKKHIVLDQKEALQGVPNTRESEGVKQLNVYLEDELLNTILILKYTIYPGLSSIVRSVEVQNNGNQVIKLNKLLSLSIGLTDQYSKWIQLSGDWARERHVIERSLSYGTTSIESITGSSSAYHNPYVLLTTEHTTEDYGDTVSVSLMYSGNHVISSEINAIGINRIQAGINPTGFSWKLEGGASFQSPEAILTYSNKGKNGNSIQLHRFIKNHIVNPKWNETRPLLINNWEATYFDFDSKVLVEIATEASSLGFDLFVLDDGWFGKRNSDSVGLGDWVVNEEKIQGGLEKLVKSINEVGMDFGIWIEPEMVNLESELYKLHPDWVVGHPRRRMSLGRNQLVLDFSNADVVDYIFDAFTSIFDSINLKYIKWDMNRSITEPFSVSLTSQNQGEFYHRYILGVYDLYERITTRYPDVMIEGCASGGNRFDLGILYYSPQIWTSDNTDGLERVKIQYGTSFAYPLSTMSSHISAVPNHQIGRSTPLRFRSDVATFGTYGYELDPRGLSEKEKSFIISENEVYKKRQHIILKGDFYRVANPFETDEASWISVLPDKCSALAGFYILTEKPNRGPIRVVFKGLSKDKTYTVSSTVVNGTYSGAYLMNLGILFEPSFNGQVIVRDSVGDFQSYLFDIKERRD